MAQIVVRNLEDEVKQRLQRRARRHGRSTEEEVREILRNAVRSEGKPRPGLGTQLSEIFRGAGLDADIQELRGHRARPARLRS